MTTIREAFEQLRIPTSGSEHKHGRHGWVQIDCPFCGQGNGKRHLGIHESGGWGNCWRCGPHSLYEVLQQLTRDAQETRDVLDSLRLVRPTRKPAVSGRLRRPVGLGPLARPHITYLSRRHLNPQVCSQLWAAQGIGVATKLAWRIYIPVIYQGQEVSWTTRAISKNAERRYITADPEQESVPAKSLLYGEDFCRGSVIVHEGPLDVWRTGPGAVALFGLNYSQAQVAKIAKYPLRVICLDNQERAQKVGARLARDLAVFPGETVQVQLESGEDPGSADQEELDELREKFLN